jgi:phospholipid transport system transporter-binding protein
MPAPDRSLIPERLRLPEALAVLGALRASLGGSSADPRVLDLAALQEIDSSALAVLLALRREHGPRLRFANAGSRLRSLARLYGIESLLFGADSTGPAS